MHFFGFLVNLKTIKLGANTLYIDVFMNQPRHTTIVNAIIDRYRETIIVNSLIENIGVFGFGRPPPLHIYDHVYPLFWRLPPPIGPSDWNDSFFIPKWEHQIMQLEPMNLNIPSTQPTMAQSLVHTTSLIYKHDHQYYSNFALFYPT